MERFARICVAVAFLILLLLLATLLRPVLQNGDSAVYNQQIASRILRDRTTHVGYIALGIIFDTVLPFSTDMNMNVMSLTFGVAGLYAVYSAAHVLNRSRWASGLAVLLALALPSELLGMLLSEVDIVSASLVAVAYACFLNELTVIAGLVFGLSVLVTPLSGPLLSVFVLTVSVSEEGPGRGAARHFVRLVRFGTAALVVYLPPVSLYYQDYVYGSRGLLHAPRAALSLLERLTHSGAFIWQEACFLIPLYVLGTVGCFASGRGWRTGQPAIALIVSVGLMALVGERFLDVPVQLPNLVLLAILPPMMLVVSDWAMRIGSIAILAVGLFTANRSFATVREEIAAREKTRTLCMGIRDQSRPRTAVLVGLSGWSESKTFARYASLDSNHLATSLTWHDFVRDERRWVESATEHEIWFFRRINQHQVSTLLDSYVLEQRSVGPRTFQVLVPR
ncbi:MAG TPA: hypothetical protein VGJ91_23570 [Polyangiaceae bacterium]|jgi:hypothetical protein